MTLLLPLFSEWPTALSAHPEALAWLHTNCSLPHGILAGTVAREAAAAGMAVQLVEARREWSQPTQIFLAAAPHGAFIANELAKRGVPPEKLNACFQVARPHKLGWLELKRIEARNGRQLAQQVARIKRKNKSGSPAWDVDTHLSLAKPLPNADPTPAVAVQAVQVEMGPTGGPVDSMMMLLRPATGLWSFSLQNRSAALEWLNDNCALDTVLGGQLARSTTTPLRLFEARRLQGDSKAIFIDGAYRPFVHSQLLRRGVHANVISDCFPRRYAPMDGWRDLKEIEASTPAQLGAHINRIRRENADAGAVLELADAKMVAKPPSVTEADVTDEGSSPLAFDSADGTADDDPAKLDAGMNLLLPSTGRWAVRLADYPDALCWLNGNCSLSHVLSGALLGQDGQLHLYEARREKSEPKTIYLGENHWRTILTELVQLGVPERTAGACLPKRKAPEGGWVDLRRLEVCDQEQLAEHIARVRRENTLALIPAPLAPSPAKASATQRKPRTKREITAENEVKAAELEAVRQLYEHACAGQAPLAVVAIDVEVWEFDHDILLEFGWSTLELEREAKTKVGQRAVSHVVIEENELKRNGTFSPDECDNFAHGTSRTLSLEQCRNTLDKLIDRLSKHRPLLLVFHSTKLDLEALKQLGLPVHNWDMGTAALDLDLDAPAANKGVFVIDTQRLWSAWTGYRLQINLGRACTLAGLDAFKLHNAGNDAHATLGLLEAMMGRQREPPEMLAPGRAPLVEANK